MENLRIFNKLKWYKIIKEGRVTLLKKRKREFINKTFN